MGMLVDVSHLSDAGFYDVCRIVKGPFVASHSNARAVCGCGRNLTDDMICKLAEHGGVTGLNFCPEFLEPKDKDPRQSLSASAAHARHIMNVGGRECLGLGSDFDGISGLLDYGTADTLPLLAEGLEKEGFSQEEIESIFYKKKALTGGDSSKVEDIRTAIEKGFSEAAKLWGDELPEISQKTHDAVMKGLDEWAKQSTEE